MFRRTRQAITAAILVIGFRSLVEGASNSTDQCISTAQKSFSRDVATLLCKHAELGLDDGPAQCALAALRTSTTVFVDKDDSVHQIIKLCDRAISSHPADCWATFSAQTRRSKEWRGPIVSVCKQANDTLPARCLIEFKRHGLSTSNRKKTEMNLVTAICSAFRGDPSAIGVCLGRSPRSIPDVFRYDLCRRGLLESVPNVVECAKQLQQRNVRPAVVARVCAFAEQSTNQPEICVLAAQQQLRWMDSEAVTQLCEYSRDTVAPVQCAVALRSWFIEQFTKDQPLTSLARLCHRALDYESIVQCAKKVPRQLFNADQVVRLCASDEHGTASLLRVECVLSARHQLFELSHRVAIEHIERDHKDQAALLVALCDKLSSSNPIECLTSTTLQSPPFSPTQRVRLCQGATSSAPFDCYRSIHSSVRARFPSPTNDAIELCRKATSAAPAACVNHLHHAPVALFQTGLAARLCQYASSVSPASCFFATPYDFSIEEKVALCQHAESDAPAACAKTSLPSVRGNILKVELCNKAKSIAPAKCAISSPFGMGVQEIVDLCRFAFDDNPSQCASAVPPHLRVPWKDIAAVCRGSGSRTPGRCLAHRVRQRIPLTSRLISECRQMESTPTTMEIVEFAHECAELFPKCAVFMKARLLDQFGDVVSSLSHGYVHFIVLPESDTHANDRLVGGSTMAPFMNGTAAFRSLYFTTAGNFTLRLTSPGIEDMVARVHVRVNETEQRERERCERVFALMQCGHGQRSGAAALTENTGRLQLLMLPFKHVLVGLKCESFWADQHELRPLGRNSHGQTYAVPQKAYQLLTGLDIPTPATSSWACLGIPEGSNRSTIRRAYHKRALEWHPDKWLATGSSSLRARVHAVYSRITSAYQELFEHTQI